MWLTILIILTVIYLFIFCWMILTYVPRSRAVTFSAEERSYIKTGKAHMSESTLTIAGLGRNSASAFTENVANFERFASLFKQVNVAVLENDSEDGTRQLYLDYIAKNQIPNLDVKLVNQGQINLPTFDAQLPRTFTGDVGHARIQKMVMLRNDLLDSVYKVFKPTDYLYISDLDLRGEIIFEGVMESFGHFVEDSEIEAISFMGIRNSLGFQHVFDPFAFVPGESDERYRVAGPSFMFDPTYHKGLFRAKSSFSGGFFVRYSAAKKTSYQFRTLSKKKAECEHVSFFSKLRVYINTNMIRYVDSHQS